MHYGGDRYNGIRDIRPESTFPNFEPQNEEMAELAQGLQRLASKIAELGNAGELRFPSARVIGMSG